MPSSKSSAPTTPPAHPTRPAPDGSETGSAHAVATPSACSDAELVKRAAQRDEAALAEFYDRHGALLYSLAMRIVAHDAPAAEQALLESMATIWERASDYSPDFGSVIGWAIAITRRAALAHRHPAAPPLTLAGSTPAPSDAAMPPAGATATPARGATARVRDALDHLHREERDAVEMAFFGGLNQAELAAKLGVPLHNARTLLRHAMMTLRDAAGGEI